MQATRILAIRHGETAWNVATRIQGQLDIPLNATGEWQAAQLAQALSAQEQIDAIYTSDLLRAYATAQAIGQAVKLPLHTHLGLRERGSTRRRTGGRWQACWPDRENACSHTIGA